MSRIVSVAHYLPKMRVKTQDMLAEIQPERYDIPANFISDRVGINEVRHAKSEHLPSDLAIKASINVINKSNIKPHEIDTIIFSGIDRDYLEPSTAHVVQHAIGAINAICFDVGNACMGFISAMEIADYMVASGKIKHVLVCTGEKHSLVTKEAIRQLSGKKKNNNYRKKIGALTVGDAGAAAIIGPKDSDSGLQIFNSHSQGKYAQLCYLKNQGQGRVDGEMDMKPICAAMINAHEKIYNETLSRLNWSAKDISCLISHQVGRRPFEQFSKIFSVSPEKMTKTYDFLGNITSATFAVNLSLALEQKRVRKGDKILVAMAGSGLSVSQFGMIA